MSQRTQVYFTREQRDALDAIAAREGRTLAEVVREAVSAYISSSPPADGQAALDAAFGSLPELSVPARDDREPWPSAATPKGEQTAAG